MPDSWAQLSQGVHPLVHRIPVRAGSAIIFTEALVHATLPWTAPHPRTTLFYKFCKQNEYYNGDFFNPEDGLGFTGGDSERVRRILRAPSAEAQRAVARAQNQLSKI